SDPFIREHIDEVTRNVRTEALTKLIKPYNRFTLDFLAKHLRISVPEVQEILSFLILDKKFRGKINQDAGTVELYSKADVERIEAMDQLGRSLESFCNSLFRDGDGFKSEDNTSMYPMSGVKEKGGMEFEERAVGNVPKARRRGLKG